MNKRIIITASIFGMIAVAFGAFGAHTIKNLVSPSSLEVWKTAVNYQFYHTFALLFLALYSQKHNNSIDLAAWFFSIGIILFSGSLYLISIKEILQLPGLAVLGPITPIGGLFFIMGWITLLIAVIKSK